MSDVVEVNSALRLVEFIEDAIIADAELVFRSPTQSLMRKASQPASYIIHFSLYLFANAERERIKRFRESRRPDLEGCGQ